MVRASIGASRVLLRDLCGRMLKHHLNVSLLRSR